MPEPVKLTIELPWATFRRLSRIWEIFDGSKSGDGWGPIIANIIDDYVVACANNDWETLRLSTDFVRALDRDLLGAEGAAIRRVNGVIGLEELRALDAAKDQGEKGEVLTRALGGPARSKVEAAPRPAPGPGGGV